MVLLSWGEQRLNCTPLSPGGLIFPEQTVKTLNPFPKKKKVSMHSPVTYWSRHCMSLQGQKTVTDPSNNHSVA
jgi:hypothetical protein